MSQFTDLKVRPAPDQVRIRDEEKPWSHPGKSLSGLLANLSIARPARNGNLLRVGSCLIGSQHYTGTVHLAGGQTSWWIPRSGKGPRPNVSWLDSSFLWANADMAWVRDLASLVSARKEICPQSVHRVAVTSMSALLSLRKRVRSERKYRRFAGGSAPGTRLPPLQFGQMGCDHIV